jgi:hypothetical protein
VGVHDATLGEPVAGLIYGLPRLEVGPSVKRTEPASDAERSPESILPPALSHEGAAKHDVFVSASELTMIVVPQTRAWVGEVGRVRIGVGSVAGRVLTLLSLGDAGAGEASAAPGTHVNTSTIGSALLCETETGEPLLIEGGVVRAVGSFSEAEGGSVLWSGELVARLPITELVRWIEKQVWERSALVGPHGARIARRDNVSLGSMGNKGGGLS